MAWPKGKLRGPRNAAPQNATQPAPQGAPEPVSQRTSPIGHNSGRAVAVGRDGEQLTRLKSTINSDKFHVPDEMVPDGWKYQWNTITVYEQPQMNLQIAAYRGGWRAVPAERHDGIWTLKGAKGEILQDGLRLEERPKILDDEAKAEELSKARRQVRDQQEALSLAKKGAAFADGGFTEDYPGAGPRVRQTVAPVNDVPRQRLEIDPAG